MADKSTGENVWGSNKSNQTDSDDNIDGDDKLKKRKLNKSSPLFPTVMYNVDKPSRSPGEIVNIAPGESQISDSFTWEPNCESFTFPKENSAERNHFNKEREIPIAPSKYVDAKLKCCDDRFGSKEMLL